jgi:hypothetical protein
MIGDNKEDYIFEEDYQSIDRYRRIKLKETNIYDAVRLKDVLHNLKPDSGADIDYCRGLIVGLISALMYKGYTYKECCSVIYMNLPSGYRRECLPENVANFIVEG